MIDPNEIAVVLLATGGSRRFGPEDKLLAPLAGEPLALHVARRISALGALQCIAVCRDAEGMLAGHLAALGFDIVVNADEALGLSRSLACGIAEAERSPAAAAFVMLADMPFVTPEHLREIMARFDPVDAPVVASTDGKAAMPPALFARSLFGSLQAAEGDRGAKALLADAVLISSAAGELADIDHPEDLPKT